MFTSISLQYPLSCSSQVCIQKVTLKNIQPRREFLVEAENGPVKRQKQRSKR